MFVNILGSHPKLTIASYSKYKQDEWLNEIATYPRDEFSAGLHVHTRHRKLLTSIIDAIVKLHHYRAAYNLFQKVTWSLFLTHCKMRFLWAKIPSRWRPRASSTQYFRPRVTISAWKLRTSQGLVYCRAEDLHQSWHLNKRAQRNILNISQETNSELRIYTVNLETYVNCVRLSQHYRVCPSTYILIFVVLQP